jgi:hypothetical protein
MREMKKRKKVVHVNFMFLPGLLPWHVYVEVRARNGIDTSLQREKKRSTCFFYLASINKIKLTLFVIPYQCTVVPFSLSI